MVGYFLLHIHFSPISESQTCDTAFRYMVDTPLSVSDTLFSLQTVQSALLTSLGSDVMTGRVPVTLWPILQCYRQTQDIKNNQKSLISESITSGSHDCVCIYCQDVTLWQVSCCRTHSSSLCCSRRTALNIGCRDWGKTMKTSSPSRIHTNTCTCFNNEYQIYCWLFRQYFSCKEVRTCGVCNTEYTFITVIMSGLILLVFATDA